MYGMMGIDATALLLGAAVIAWIVKRNENADLSPVLREGIWLGVLLTFILKMIVARYMSGGISSRFVANYPDVAPTLPLFD